MQSAFNYKTRNSADVEIVQHVSCWLLSKCKTTIFNTLDHKIAIRIGFTMQLAKVQTYPVVSLNF